MDRMLYVAMSGAKQTMLAQASNSHNLANVSTTAYKAETTGFRSMPVYGEGFPSRVYAMAEKSAIDYSSGFINPTGRELDVAIEGEGWIAIQDQNGNEAYTRAGNLKIAIGGLLTDVSGNPIMGNNGVIVLPPADKLEIGRDGTISILPTGQSAANLAVVDRIKLVNPEVDLLFKDNNGLMRLKEEGISNPDISVKLVSGALESSNVNPVDVLVNQIELSRRFELQIKAMKTAEEADSATAQMLRMS